MEIIDRDAYERLYAEGYTHKEIAKRLYVGTATLSVWKRRQGISCYRSAADYIDLRRQGYRDKHIAARWCITPHALYQWKVKHNVPAEYFRQGRYSTK